MYWCVEAEYKSIECRIRCNITSIFVASCGSYAIDFPSCHCWLHCLQGFAFHQMYLIKELHAVLPHVKQIDEGYNAACFSLWGDFYNLYIHADCLSYWQIACAVQTCLIDIFHVLIRRVLVTDLKISRVITLACAEMLVHKRITVKNIFKILDMTSLPKWAMSIATVDRYIGGVKCLLINSHDLLPYPNKWCSVWQCIHYVAEKGKWSVLLLLNLLVKNAS